MGNWLTCCLKASPSPSASFSPKLDGGSRHVKSKCESEVHEEAARDTGPVETVPATPKSEKLNSGALKRHHLKNISAPVTVQEQGKRKNNDDFPGRLPKRCTSFPTVFLYDDTVSQPDFSTIIQAMTIAIYDNITYRVGNRSFDIFDERRHPFRHEVIIQANFLDDPEPNVVYRFVCALFSAEHLTAECAIVTLIYLERVMRYAIIDMCPTNWKRILLGAAIVAYELWDKQALWDVPYCQLIDNIITVEDMLEGFTPVLSVHWFRPPAVDYHLECSHFASKLKLHVYQLFSKLPNIYVWF